MRRSAPKLDDLDSYRILAPVFRYSFSIEYGWIKALHLQGATSSDGFASIFRGCESSLAMVSWSKMPWLEQLALPISTSWFLPRQLRLWSPASTEFTAVGSLFFSLVRRRQNHIVWNNDNDLFCWDFYCHQSGSHDFFCHCGWLTSDFCPWLYKDYKVNPRWIPPYRIPSVFLLG
jgi:hypothetical protein